MSAVARRSCQLNTIVDTHETDHVARKDVASTHSAKRHSTSPSASLHGCTVPVHVPVSSSLSKIRLRELHRLFLGTLDHLDHLDGADHLGEIDNLPSLGLS